MIENRTMADGLQSRVHYISVFAPFQAEGEFPSERKGKGRSLANTAPSSLEAHTGSSKASASTGTLSLSNRAGLQVPSLRRFEYSQIHMGTRVRIILYTHTQAGAEDAAKSAFARFAELDLLLSDYNPDSELMRLGSAPPHTPVTVSRDVFAVLQRAQEVACLTEGAFDVTAGAFTHLWRKAREKGRIPTEEEILSARSRVGWQYVALDEVRATVTLLKPNVLFDVGGIAKGYACDEALRVLFAKGILRALVEAGGDIAVSGPPPGQRGWLVRLPDGSTLSVVHCGVSTSGDAEQFLQRGSERYSHILNPRTGKALIHQNTVTVIAQDAFTSDPLATALSVLPPESTTRARLSERFPHQAYIFRAPF
ncbi:MAG: FAD:protein FMN transferase [Fimbriimonadales bacterium]|nr:FAD:protein FMN transferase [Fimbriimonadales bacterium]